MQLGSATPRGGDDAPLVKSAAVCNANGVVAPPLCPVPTAAAGAASSAWEESRAPPAMEPPAVAPLAPLRAPSRVVEAAGALPRKRARALRALSEFTDLRAVGEGTYGKVMRALDVGGRLVALKKLKLDAETFDGFPTVVVREMRALQMINEPHTVELLGVAVDPPTRDVYMVFPYSEFDLAGLASLRCLTPSHVRCYLFQVLEALMFAHKLCYVHRDIKSSNILVDRDHNVRIADWGLARMKHGSMTPKVVTLWYRAPELLLGCSKYTTAVDMWSVGYARVPPGRRARRARAPRGVMSASAAASSWQSCSRAAIRSSQRIWSRSNC